MTGSDPLLRTKHVAALLDVSVNTLSDWHRRGYGPTAYKVGRQLRYRRSEVDAWLAAQAVGGAA